MPKTIHIAGAEIQAGQRQTINIPVANLYTHTEMTMPVHVIHGKKTGPCLFVSAAIHGDEINGVEIIRRLLKLKLLRQIHGTLIAIPIVNVFGFINHSRYLPDRRDLNRSFPGLEKGSLASYLARLFMDEIVTHCTHGIDLHTGAAHRTNLPQIRASLDSEETKRLAQAFGAPVIIDARIRDGSLREAVAEQGIPMLLYEAGEALRFNEIAIAAGLKGVVSVMREIGLLPKRPQPKRAHKPLIAQSSSWVRAGKSGILSKPVRLGTLVSEGDLLAKISDPFGESDFPVYAATSGIVIGCTKLPLVYKGDALFHVASFSGELSEQRAMDLLDLGLEPEPLHT